LEEINERFGDEVVVHLADVNVKDGTLLSQTIQGEKDEKRTANTFHHEDA